MKKQKFTTGFLLLTLLLFASFIAHAQNVAINTDGSKANPNAILDIKSADKGLLIPRMSTEVRMKIPNTQGLIVYDVSTNSFWYNTGKQWLDIPSSISASYANNAWLLTGNDINQTGGFLGTTHGHLPIRVNDVPSGLIDPVLEVTFFGYACATNGHYSTAIGSSALHNGGAVNNTAVGAYAIASNTGGIANTGIGRSAMHSNTNGINNSAVGAFTMYSNTSGSYNSAMGVNAMFSNTTGKENTAVGWEALYSNTAGESNVAIGRESMWINRTGNSNTAVGAESMFNNSTGSGNTATGFFSLGFSAIGNQNSAFGFATLGACHQGNDNTGVGAFSLVNNTHGNRNAALGYNALTLNSTGSGNTAVGANSGVTANNFNNATAIGFEAIVNASNKVRIGNAAVTVIEGQVPFTTPSDGRFKFGVQEDVKGLDFIMQLRPVTYQFDVKKFDADLGISASSMGSNYDVALQLRRSGFIAQEVEQAALKTGYNFSGVIRPASAEGHYSLSYDAFVVPLVKGMQEQQKTINLQQQVIDKQQQSITEQDKKISDQDKKMADLQQQLDELKNALKKLQTQN